MNLRTAKAFHEVVAPYFKGLSRHTLVDCCAGDGKAGMQFSRKRNVGRIVFVDITKVKKFSQNIEGLKKPFELSVRGMEHLKIDYEAVLIALHACGELTDLVLEKAVSSKSPVAVMPCCYRKGMSEYKLRNPPDKRRLLYESKKDYYDAVRMQFLRESGYDVSFEQILPKITGMNNVIIGLPDRNC